MVGHRTTPADEEAREQVTAVWIDDAPSPLPPSLAGLLDYVALGIDRLELTQQAFRKGMAPIWELGPAPDERILILHFQDRRWYLRCRLQAVRVH